jgi:hypothetical protein
MNGCINSIILVALCGIMFTRCSESPVSRSGGDDFPNMIADAGGAIARNLEQEWENPGAAEVDPSALAQPALPFLEPEVGGIGKRSLLAKTSVADSLWFAIDPVAGTITLFSRKDTLDAVRYDTLVTKVNGADTLIVSFAGAVVANGIPATTERYRYTDYDGDSLLYSSTAEKQQVLVVLQREGALGRVETGRYVVDAGPDGDFDLEEDNKVVFTDALVTVRGDTLSFMAVLDGDGDGFAIDNEIDSDSCLVDLSTVAFAETALAVLRRSATTARMVVFPADSQKNYAVRYAVENIFATRTVHWTVLKTDGDSTFFPGDTVNVYRITTATDDSLDIDTMRIGALLGEDGRDTLDDSLLGIYLHVKFLRGNDREVRFDYTAETPIPSGGEPSDGTVYFSTTFRDGSRIEVDGSLEETVISAEVTITTDSGEKRYAVTWDYAGEVVSVEELD